MAFTNSTAVHLDYKLFQQQQILNFLSSVDPDRRGRLAEACAYIVKSFPTMTSRKGLRLLELYASLIEAGFSSIVPAEEPPAGQLRSSHVAASAVTVALGVVCVAGIFRTLRSSRASSGLGNTEGLLRSHMI